MTNATFFNTHYCIPFPLSPWRGLGVRLHNNNSKVLRYFNALYIKLIKINDVYTIEVSELHDTVCIFLSLT